MTITEHCPLNATSAPNSSISDIIFTRSNINREKSTPTDFRNCWSCRNVRVIADRNYDDRKPLFQGGKDHIMSFSSERRVMCPRNSGWLEKGHKEAEGAGLQASVHFNKDSGICDSHEAVKPKSDKKGLGQRDVPEYPRYKTLLVYRYFRRKEPRKRFKSFQKGSDPASIHWINVSFFR